MCMSCIRIFVTGSVYFLCVITNKTTVMRHISSQKYTFHICICISIQGAYPVNTCQKGLWIAWYLPEKVKPKTVMRK